MPSAGPAAPFPGCRRAGARTGRPRSPPHRPCLRPKATDEVAAPAAPAGRALQSSVDSPQGWNVLPGKILLRGWCYADDGGQAHRRPRGPASRPHRGRHASWPAAPGRRRFRPGQRQQRIQRLADRARTHAGGSSGSTSRSPTTRAGGTRSCRPTFEVGAASAPLEIVSYEQWIDAYDTLRRSLSPNCRRRATRRSALVRTGP